MNRELLERHAKRFVTEAAERTEELDGSWEQRTEHVEKYQAWTEDRLRGLTEDELYEYIAPLWAMKMWGNKHHVVDKAIADNGMPALRNHLADLVWSEAPVAERWDSFRKNIKNIGPAMMSELLNKTHPHEYALWNRRAYIGLNYLEIQGLPRHSYQVTGSACSRVCDITKEIARVLAKAGLEDPSLLMVDFFIWDELQVEKTLYPGASKNSSPSSEAPILEPRSEAPPYPFVHNDIRDMARDIGEWLGFSADTEKKVAEGAVVDAIWEATIGNMGRVIYAFEVQTKGSIDSLLVNLQKAMNNPAVQGVVAISDRDQLQKIRRHAEGVGPLSTNLKYWDYEEVARVHEALEGVYETINGLGLVPDGF